MNAIGKCTVVSMKALLGFCAYGTIFMFTLLCLKARKQKNTHVYGRIYAFIMPVDPPRIHDEVTNNDHSATSNTAFTSPLARATILSNK